MYTVSNDSYHIIILWGKKGNSARNVCQKCQSSLSPLPGLPSFQAPGLSAYGIMLVRIGGTIASYLVLKSGFWM